MSQQKLAIVTGGNKGIGFAIVQGLCEKFQGIVYLTSRDEKLGKEAVDKLKELGLNPRFHQLNIDDPKSVETFKNYVKTNYGGVDILINNAGIAFKGASTEPFGVQAEVTIKTNYYGTLRMSEAFLPLLKNGAQLIQMSSSAGHLFKVPSPELRSKLSSDQLTIENLSLLMEEFIRSAKSGNNVELGWGSSAYSISKVGVSALARIQQRMVDALYPDKNISVNSCHPGYVSTDMSSHKGPLTIEEGAVSALYLALAPHGLKGKYIWSDCAVIEWTAPNAPY
nr:carbonyl reductase [NADPH] 1-like [Onthophagus taurus]